MSQELEALIVDLSSGRSAPTDLEIVLAKIETMQTTMDAILLKFEGIAGEVAPVVDAISTHPLFKMLGGNKR